MCAFLCFSASGEMLSFEDDCENEYNSDGDYYGVGGGGIGLMQIGAGSGVQLLLLYSARE